LTASAPEQVDANARPDTYWFTATLPSASTIPSNDAQRRGRPHDWETKRGDLEVSTDGGGYEDKKR
jgi:hypothetical protein